MATLSADLAVALVRRDVAGVVDAVADRLALPADVSRCPNPRCRGVLPGDGPDARVCRCGTAWEAS